RLRQRLPQPLRASARRRACALCTRRQRGIPDIAQRCRRIRTRRERAESRARTSPRARALLGLAALKGGEGTTARRYPAVAHDRAEPPDTAGFSGACRVQRTTVLWYSAASFCGENKCSKSSVPAAS